MKLILTTATIATLLAVPPFLGACTLPPCMDGMRSTFAIRVTLEGKSLSGVNVRIRPDDSATRGAFAGITGGDGAVRVQNLGPGRYWLEMDFMGISFHNGCLRLSDDSSPGTRELLTFDLDRFAPLRAVRQVRGAVSELQRVEPRVVVQPLSDNVIAPIPGLPLTLVDPFTRVDVYAARSDRDGQFSFGTVPNGLYVLVIDAGRGPSGQNHASTSFLIKVMNTVSRSHIRLTRGVFNMCTGQVTTFELSPEPK